METKPLIAFLMFWATMVTAALILMAYSNLRAPSPYMLRSDAELANRELQKQINTDEANQQTFNANTTNQFASISDRMDNLGDDLDRVMRVERMPIRKRRAGTKPHQ